MLKIDNEYKIDDKHKMNGFSVIIINKSYNDSYNRN